MSCFERNILQPKLYADMCGLTDACRFDQTDNYSWRICYLHQPNITFNLFLFLISLCRQREMEAVFSLDVLGVLAIPMTAGSKINSRNLSVAHTSTAKLSRYGAIKVELVNINDQGFDCAHFTWQSGGHITCHTPLWDLSPQIETANWKDKLIPRNKLSRRHRWVCPTFEWVPLIDMCRDTLPRSLVIPRIGLNYKWRLMLLTAHMC